MDMAPPRNPVFDHLLAEGAGALLSGTQERDEPPVDGGDRWPVTVVCLPRAGTDASLDGWLTEVREFAGPGHFLTGSSGASHVTVRALENYREAASPDEPIVADWVCAMRSAARAHAPLRFMLTGFTLTRSTVVAQLEPLDDEPEGLRRSLRDALGARASFEEGFTRDIWYSSLLHFAAPVLDPGALVRWVLRHREIEPEPVTLDTMSLVRYRYRDGRQRRMALEEWETVPFTG